MPLLNEGYWRERVGTSAATWSGDRWLDWEHGVVIRRAYRRVWPYIERAVQERVPNAYRRPLRVLDVGAGDGRFSAWMAWRFEADVLAGDGIDWPISEDVLDALYDWKLMDAERLTDDPAVLDFEPDVVMFTNSLTCMSDWALAVRQARQVAPVLVVFDNLIDPTPEWHRNLPHRTPIPNRELVAVAKSARYWLEAAVAADVLHRRLFLATPKWMHPAVAVASAVGDVLASEFVPATKARHSAWVFGAR